MREMEKRSGVDLNEAGNLAYENGVIAGQWRTERSPSTWNWGGVVAILKKEAGSLVPPNARTNPRWIRNLNIKRKLKNTERKHK